MILNVFRIGWVKSERDVLGRFVREFYLLALVCLLAANIVPISHASDDRKIFIAHELIHQANIAEYTYSYPVPRGDEIAIEALAFFSDSKWNEPNSDTPNFGYSDREFWFRYSVRAADEESSGRYYYQVNNPVVDVIDVYVFANNALEAAYHSGDSLLYSNRPIKSNTFDFPLDLKADKVHTIYIRLKSQGTIQLPAVLYYEDQYKTTTLGFYIGQGLYFGVVGIMLFYNFFLFFVFRSDDYLYYVLYGVSIAIVQLTMHGFSFQYLWPESIWWNSKAIPLSMFSSSLFMLAFTKAYFRLPNIAVKTNHLGSVLIGMTTIGLISSLILPYSLAIKTAVFSVLAIIPFCAFASIMAWKHNTRAAQIYWLAWSVMFVGAIFLVLQKLGLFPTNFITSNGWQLGTGLEIIVLSFALGLKIKDVSESKLYAEREAQAANQRALDIQVKANEDLETLVAERTEKLRIKNRDMLTLLDNIKHGLLTINGDGHINGEYSAFLETILGTQRIAGKSCFDLLFEQSTLTKDKLSLAGSAVNAIIGADGLNYEFNEFHLPKELTIIKGNFHQSLELEWLPLENEGIVEQMMVSIRDVTEANALRERNTENEMEWKLITLFLKAGESHFREYILSNSSLLTQSRQYLIELNQSQSALAAIPINALFRNMHTVKGNSRAFGFEDVANKAHSAESLLASFRDTSVSIKDIAGGLSAMDELLELLQKYKWLASERIGWNIEVSPSIDISKLTYMYLCQFLNDHSHLDGVSEILPKLVDAFYLPLSELLHIPISSLDNIAKTLSKPTPSVVIDSGGMLFVSDQANFFNGFFNHIFRNALDHGIESPKERIEKGKPGAGKVFILINSKQDRFVMKIYDDGRGLNLLKLRQDMQRRGMKDRSLDRVADYAFFSGSTTAEQVTDISGRGVGLDAVKDLIFSANGSIRIEFDQEEETGDGFIPFYFLIELPRASFVLQPLASK